MTRAALSAVIGDDDLRLLWRAGVPANEIALLCGVQYPAVNRRALSLGLPPRARGGRGVRPCSPVTDDLGDGEILALLEAQAEGRLDGAARVVGVPVVLARVVLAVVAADHHLCGCGRAANRDGGMAQGWWRAGLARRGAA